MRRWPAERWQGEQLRNFCTIGLQEAMAWAAIVQARCRLAPELAILPAVVTGPDNTSGTPGEAEGSGDGGNRPGDGGSSTRRDGGIRPGDGGDGDDQAMVAFDPAMAESTW